MMRAPAQIGKNNQRLDKLCEGWTEVGRKNMVANSRKTGAKRCRILHAVQPSNLSNLFLNKHTVTITQLPYTVLGNRLDGWTGWTPYGALYCFVHALL